MREIKFELREGKDEQSSKRIGYESYDPNFDGGAWYYVLDSDDIMQAQTYFPKRIMDKLFRRQYTGLKDKNGKEIYEGDIIQQISADGKNPLWEVVWHENAWCIRLISHKPPYHVRLSCKLVAEWDEVIGNIYENPELLEK